MKNYTQLTLAQRYQIEALLQAGFSQTSIAIQLGFHRSTICRELKRSIALRGRTSGTYVALNAARKSQNRHKEKPKKIVLPVVHLGEINFNFIHIPFKYKIIQVLNHCKSSYFRKSSGCQS